jgi:hypothetical protein
MNITDFFAGFFRSMMMIMIRDPFLFIHLHGNVNISVINFRDLAEETFSKRSKTSRWAMTHGRIIR